MQSPAADNLVINAMVRSRKTGLINPIITAVPCSQTVTTHAKCLQAALGSKTIFPVATEMYDKRYVEKHIHPYVSGVIWKEAEPRQRMLLSKS